MASSSQIAFGYPKNKALPFGAMSGLKIDFSKTYVQLNSLPTYFIYQLFSNLWFVGYNGKISIQL